MSISSRPLLVCKNKIHFVPGGDLIIGSLLEIMEWKRQWDDIDKKMKKYKVSMAWKT